jgi:SAM-dependent methyltransferase
MRRKPAQRPTGTEGYAESADVLAAQYESIAFADVYRDVLQLLPSRPGRVLDIGAGTGRDAAALASIGHHVTAVEPTQELRQYGERLHSEARIEWVDDTLPDLNRVLARNEQFDLILLTAVWMHLEGDERRTAMRRTADLLAPSSLIIMSLRHGPIPDGRRMFDVSGEETCRLAKQSGLQVLRQSEREDMLGRAEIRWTFLVFKNGRESVPADD